MNQVSMAKGAVRTFSQEFIIDDSLSATLSSAAWEVSCGDSVEISNASSPTGNTVTATVTAKSAGCSIIKVTAKLSNSEVDPAYIKVNVKEPKC